MLQYCIFCTLEYSIIMHFSATGTCLHCKSSAKPMHIKHIHRAKHKFVCDIADTFLSQDRNTDGQLVLFPVCGYGRTVKGLSVLATWPPPAGLDTACYFTSHTAHLHLKVKYSSKNLVLCCMHSPWWLTSWG